MKLLLLFLSMILLISVNAENVAIDDEYSYNERDPYEDEYKDNYEDYKEPVEPKEEYQDDYRDPYEDEYKDDYEDYKEPAVSDEKEYRESYPEDNLNESY